ncbi:MAG: hypothetical protein VYC39_13120 [Myxococcota bacterium]|nr:hypothetical protein [Myxococcota bacterium]
MTASLFLSSVPTVLDLVVDEREPVAMMVKTPRGELASARISEILRVANDVFRKHTGLRVDSMEIAGVDRTSLSECDPEEQLSCWSRLLINAYTTDSERSSPKLLMVTSVIPDSNKGDRFSTLLIDLPEVQRILEKASLGGQDLSINVEDTIFERAVETVRGFTLVSNLESTNRYFKDLITQQLRQKLRSIGQWRPFGEIRLTGGKGMMVMLEGQLVGSLADDQVFIRGLRAGQRKLELRSVDGSIRPVELNEMVPAGQTVDVSVKQEPNLQGLEASKSVMRWTGLGTALVGAGIAVTALVLPVQAQTISPCPGDACLPDERNTFARACDYSSRERGESCAGLNNVLVAPLGYSIMASGVSLSALSYIEDETGNFRWWTPLASVAIGVLSYGLSAL